jgi:hypothetical protein
MSIATVDAGGLRSSLCPSRIIIAVVAATVCRLENLPTQSVSEFNQPGHFLPPLARICSRVDYVNGLQEQPEGQQAASEEVREQFKALVEECGAALSSRAEEND